MKTLIQSVMTPSLFLAVLLLGSGSAPLAQGTAISRSPSVTETAPARLVEVGHEAATGPIVFDMGDLNQMDEAQRHKDFAEENKFFPWQPGYHRVLQGAKHNFQLKNNGTENVTIADIQDDSLYVEAEVVEDGRKRTWPDVVKPGETVSVRVAFNFYLSSPGLIRERVNLLEANSKRPLATLVIQGNVKGGINFLENALDFGKVKAESKSREFTLVFDKHVPYQMTPAPLTLISSNPFVTVESLDGGKTIMGVRVENAQMTFPMDVDLPQELRLHFRAKLSDQVPVGAIDGHVDLIMQGAPLAIIVRNVSLPIRGEVTGKR